MGEAVHVWEQGLIYSLVSAQFFYEPKTAVKLKSIKFFLNKERMKQVLA